MNFLAHLHLSDPGAESWIGSLIPDFGDKADPESYPATIYQAIVLHRRIDVFTDNHPVFARSRSRINERYRLLKGILVDMFYDHFLAKHWSGYHEKSLELFSDSVYDALRSNRMIMPVRLQRASDYMIAENWLVSYRELDGIDLVLKRMERRLSRPTVLGDGIQALVENYTEIEKDFKDFYPDLQDFVEREKKAVRSDKKE